MKIQPTPEVMHALELCISDRTKPVLMANERFIPYLIAGLGLAKLRDDLPMLPPGAHEADKLAAAQTEEECKEIRGLRAPLGFFCACL